MNQKVEMMAERIVLHALGGKVRQRDNGYEQAMVDLIIDTPDCSGVAIEVTSLTPEDAAKFQDASSKFGGPRGDLDRTWKVRFLRSAKIKKVAPQLVALLRDLEAAGVAQIDLKNLTDDEQCFAHRVRQLGAVEVSSVEGPGWILIVDRSIGSAEASGEILAVVATCILKDPKRVDNAEKLKKTGLSHRHLFLYISPLANSTYEAIAQALLAGFVPSAPLSVSEDYTGVWIAVGEDQPVARWTRESGWKVLAPA